MNTWAQVDKLRNQEEVNAETLNRPVDQLASRTEYLKKRLNTILDEGVQSALILNDVDLVSEDSSVLHVGDVVYRVSGGFAKAQAKMHLYDDFKTADSAFTIGILISTTGTRGDVLIYGKMDIGAYSAMTKSGILQSGEKFRSGRYYLSATEPGKLTANPSGPLIYVGSFHSEESDTESFSSDSVAYINPQFLDIGTSHVHRAYPLVARPAGDVVDGDVVGYYPDTATSSEKQYPSLVFGGTWTSTDDVEYVFTLQNSSSWGNVELRWYKNGDTSTFYKRSIPAPGVEVAIDNGLTVKVNFPEATSSNAFTSTLSDAERTWTLSFPDAGKGWVNHSVDAIASENGESSAEENSCDVLTPGVHVALTGSWPSNDSTLSFIFPEKAYEKKITSSTSSVVVGATTYEILEDGASPSAETNVPVTKGGTVEETMHNLAVAINKKEGSTVALAGDTKIVTIGLAITEGTDSTGSDFDVVGGTIPLMICYTADGYLLAVVKNKPTYTPLTIGGLKASVFATGASSSSNYTCKTGTVLTVSAYDYAPEAIYDYVMGLHQEVDYYYPPVPAQAAGLFVNGVEMESSALFPENPTYVIGRKTLHWMEENEDLRPWPEALTSHDDVIADPADDKTMAFYFIVGFQCASGPVTSIVPAPNAPIKIYTYGTNDEAYTGDVMIDAAFDFNVADAGVKGYNVAKQGKGGKLLAGPVVEKIKAGNGIVITQPAGCPAGQGTVTIGLDDGTLRNSFSEVALENAKQEKLGLFSYISLLGWSTSGNIPSAFTAMMRVPSNLDKDKDYRLQLRMVMFGTTGFEDVRRKAAGIRLEYNVLPDYTDETHLSMKTGLLVPDNPKYRDIAVPFGHLEGDDSYKYTAYDPFVATTIDDTAAPKKDDVCVAFSSLPIPAVEEFTDTTKDISLKPGYLVAIRVSRIATPTSTESNYSAYTSPVGFLSMEWSLEEA